MLINRSSQALINNLALEPSESELRGFFARSSTIISVEGKIASATEEQKKICLLFENGDFLVDKEHLNDHQIRVFRDICRRRKININKTYLVDIKTIRLLYEFEEKQFSATAQTQQEPMERTAGQLLAEASQLNVSDIHIKVHQFEAEIWFRRNGEMQFVRHLDAARAHALLSTYYNAAEDADATYRIYDYQAARISGNSRLSLPQNLQSVRLQFNPLGAGGRYMIARLLYAENRWSEKKFDLNSLGLHPIQLKALAKLRQLPEGINIISGPTGSGKSTTLKFVLELLYEERQRQVNILTIEDPPEYDILGAAQLPVTNVDTEEERGLAYGKSITAALRSDPDIIMPGEARDSTVINLVFTAAMTGHQVWTSIHANNSLAVFDRLRDQGVERYKMTDPSLLTGILSQRLVKVLCPHCHQRLTQHANMSRHGIDMQMINSCFSEELLGKIYVVNPKGCDSCSGGYKGRTVIAELILPDQHFLNLMADGHRKEAGEYWLSDLGGISLSEHVWLKIIAGLVDPFDGWIRIGRLDQITEERKARLLEIREDQ